MKSFYDSVIIATQLETALLKSYAVSQLKILHTVTVKKVALNGHYKNGSVFTIKSLTQLMVKQDLLSLLNCITLAGVALICSFCPTKYA